jgi:hypothetical protein
MIFATSVFGSVHGAFAKGVNQQPYCAPSFAPCRGVEPPHASTSRNDTRALPLPHPLSCDRLHTKVHCAPEALAPETSLALALEIALTGRAKSKTTNNLGRLPCKVAMADPNAGWRSEMTRDDRVRVRYSC